MYVCLYLHIYNGLIIQSALAELTEFSGCGFKSHSDQLSAATSKNSSVVNTIFGYSFSLNSCDCLRSEYNFF